MKKSLNKKFFKWMFSAVPLTVAAVLPLGMTTATHSNDFGQTEDNSKLYIEKNTAMSEYIALVENSNSIAELVNQTTFNYRKPQFIESVSTLSEFQEVLEQGANRVDIVFKYDVNKEKVQNYVSEIENALKDDFATIYAKYTLTFSIAFKDLEDFKKLVLKMMDLKIDYNDLLQVNVHETGRSAEEFSPSYFNDINNEPIGGGYSDPNDYPFWKNYYSINKRRYELVGLDGNTIQNQRILSTSYNKKHIKLGILEAQPKDTTQSPIVNPNSRVFTSENKIITRQNAGQLTNELTHANVVAEIMVGKQGLNPYSILYSDKTGDWNGWLNSSLNWYLYNGVYILNNSWKAKESFEESYNIQAEWLDNFLNANEDFIYIAAAGNDYQNFKDGKSLKYMDGYNIAQNIINVGALELYDWVIPAFLTEESKDVGYVTTAVPDVFRSTVYPEVFDLPRGTSTAAPTVTGMASFLKANYDIVFEKGSDYLILKSALISGSRNNNVWKRFDPITGEGLHNVYDGRVGFGRADFNKVFVSLASLSYLKIFANGSQKSRSQTDIHLRSGQKYRANITWKGQDMYKTKWVNDFLFFGHTEYEFVGPINLNLQITTPDGKKIRARRIEQKTTDKEHLMNTETIEFEAKTSGVYKVEVLYDSSEKSDRRKDLDVAFTYSEL
ncbi:hypothetical protein CJJ23_00375 [Mycoplasmopsis agassizii]|uniref:Peptidase S8/S53 domain-containing protein n=1 Tax=Mycoplasmopsis agassizii TaxID=33922 RepID=A0A269TKA5_9BACT|nr:S8 family serine peptidase [Mycoplasmopsis agassizii]PAK21787.1 hypothetical protein CJJ23_00375 [Mycoplasmopsis agassizii]